MSKHEGIGHDLTLVSPRNHAQSVQYIMSRHDQRFKPNAISMRRLRRHQNHFLVLIEEERSL
eukprot:1160542-Pelagomonas_calceolata.AAC.3